MGVKLGSHAKVKKRGDVGVREQSAENNT